MALSDQGPPWIYDWAIKSPSEWVTVLHLWYQLTGYWEHYSYFGVMQGINASKEQVQPGLISIDNFTYRSPAMGGGEEIREATVTMKNNWVGGSRLFTNPPQDFYIKSPRPTIGDMLATHAEQGLNIQVELSVQLQIVESKFTLCRQWRVDQILSITREEVMFSIVEDKRWDETFPRHRVNDRTVSGGGSGAPLFLHYGRWGGHDQNLGTLGVGYSPHGHSASAFSGGFRSPVPCVVLGDTGAVGSDRGREVSLGRYFGLPGEFQWENSEDFSIYYSAGDVLARLHRTNLPVTRIENETPGSPPENMLTLKIRPDIQADLPVFPDAVWTTSGGLSSVDPLGNMIDHRSSTKCDFVLDPSTKHIVTLNFGPVQNRGMIKKLYLVLELGAPGGTDELDTTITIKYGPLAGDVLPATPTPLTWPVGSLVSGELHTHVVDVTGANNNTKNNFHQWDFSYNDSSNDPAVKSPAQIIIGLDNTANAGSNLIYVRNVYLLVQHIPFLRLIDRDAVLARDIERSRARSEAGGGGLAPYNVHLTNTFERLGIDRFQFYADSKGQRDDASGTFTGFVDGTIENPCSIIAHMLTKYPRLTATAPTVEFGTGTYLDLERVRDRMNSLASVVNLGTDPFWRCRWMFGSEIGETVWDSCQRLAAEAEGGSLVHRCWFGARQAGR